MFLKSYEGSLVNKTPFYLDVVADKLLPEELPGLVHERNVVERSESLLSRASSALLLVLSWRSDNEKVC